MIFKSIHHIAIIGRNYNKTKEFYIEKLGFEIISEHHRVDKKPKQYIDCIHDTHKPSISQDF